MKRCLLVAVVLIATVTISFSQTSSTPYFLSNPCLTPDGSTVIFSFEGDLWKASVKDGNAVRLTAMQGYETNPRVSPDGKWIAFTGRQYGNPDVYLMPVNGGDVKQLTFHSSSDDVSSWSWDSRYIYFNSNRMGQIAGFKVAATGGTPERVFGNYFFQYDHNLVESPTTGEIFFNDTWESSNQVQRKRYKGPFNPDIQSYNVKTKAYKRYTDWEGKDFGATIDRQGTIYFISDEANGEYNLYTFNKGKKEGLTKFSTSIKSPNVNADGGKVVFEKDYRLWLYDVKSGKAEMLPISLFRNNVLPKEQDFEVRGKISYFDVSPDGKKLAFISRGEVFVSDVEGKFIQQIDRHSEERASEVKWLSDNKTLLLNQTIDGYSNIYSVPADGSGSLQRLTNEKKNDRSFVMNKTRSKMLYLSGRDEVRLLDTKTLQGKTIAKEEIWGFEGSNPSFSPNDEYVAFTVFRNFEQDIFVCNLKDGKVFNLTNTDITEADPTWSADGKYIYCTSQRLKASYPYGMPNAHIYRIPLEKLDEPYRIDKFNELFKDEKKDTTKKAAPVADVKPITIDMNRIMERMEQVGPGFGYQSLQAVYQKGDKTNVLYVSTHADGKPALWKTTMEPFEQPKTEKITGSERSFGTQVVEVSDKLFALANGTINKLNLDANKMDPISIGYTFRRNLAGEFREMFEEAWAQMDENYYDGHFHGLDWDKTRKYYEQFIPYLNNRGDLRILLNDMLGELNSSHQGFNTFGDDEQLPMVNRTMETGIVFENSNPYKVKYVISRSAADKKDIDIRPGDVLTRVNDQDMDPSMDRNFYFTVPSLDKELRLSFTRNGQTVEAKIHPQPSLFANLYDEWIDNNQARVDERSKGKIAYGCMKNMGQGEIDQFIIDMTRELNNKDALIVDLRYNTGGNVHDQLLQFLSQRSYLKWKYRDGQFAPQPNFAPSDKPIVLLVNEQSLSDAEMTSQGFKALKLGTIIGNGTYRWIIFTSAVGLVDGSSVRMPSWGCYSLEGKDIEANGVQPDILVINSFSDKLEGRDPQLDRAVDELLKKLK